MILVPAARVSLQSPLSLSLPLCRSLSLSPALSRPAVDRCEAGPPMKKRQFMKLCSALLCSALLCSASLLIHVVRPDTRVRAGGAGRAGEGAETA